MAPRHRALIALLAATAGAAAFAVPAQAQREIVQPLPRAEAGDLNTALRRLSRNPSDLAALISAGEASLALDDLAAAEGFFLRALAVAPSNGFAKLGMARVSVAKPDPITALRLFEEAEASGIPSVSMAADRAFAYDLVGDQRRAQPLYRIALEARDVPEIRRRFALSLAVSGNREAFEAAIYPLLTANDKPAFRARAFGLAILGEEEESIVIAETMLPTDLALRMAPYLRYMSRLTAAQQVAAANLGVFPRASQIGKDDAAIAAYAAQGQRISRNADAALTPTGRTMGAERPRGTTARRNARSEPRRRRPDRGRNAASARPISAEPAAQAPARTEPASAPQTTPPPVPVTVAIETPPVSPPPPTRPPAREETPPVVIALPDPVRTPAPEAEPAPQASVSAAFADFDLASQSSPAVAGDAVDISSIRPPREVEQVEPAAPAHPARHWVQVATGRDLAALRFDWRRIARGADGTLDGKGPFTTPWGQSNRLLAGPYDSAGAAREKVNQLKALGVDSFPWSSDEGEAVSALD